MKKLHLTCRRVGVRPTQHILVVSVSKQSMEWHSMARLQRQSRGRFRISTSRFGIGQVQDSEKTPLGLHRIAKKIGGGHPIGTVFKSREAVGLTWVGQPDAIIVHRILWLEGLESGTNRGGKVDTYARYIYIHGYGDETTLGKPRSCGCIHVAAADLMPLYEKLPVGTLVWIEA